MFQRKQSLLQRLLKEGLACSGSECGQARFSSEVSEVRGPAEVSLAGLGGGGSEESGLEGSREGVQVEVKTMFKALCRESGYEFYLKMEMSYRKAS